MSTKYFFYALILVAIGVLAFNIIPSNAPSTLEQNDDATNSDDAPQYTTVSHTESGLQFEYPTTYVLEEPAPGKQEHPDFVKAYILTEQKAYDELHASEGGREGPPNMSVLIFETSEPLEDWLESELNFTNYQKDAATPVEINGNTALRYTWEGLYFGDTVAVQTSNHIILFNNSFTVPDDPQRAIFNTLLGSVTVQ